MGSIKLLPRLAWVPTTERMAFRQAALSRSDARIYPPLTLAVVMMIFNLTIHESFDWQVKGFAPAVRLRERPGQPARQLAPDPLV